MLSEPPRSRISERREPGIISVISAVSGSPALSPYLSHQSPLSLVGDVLVVAAVQLLHAGQELVLRHAAHHGGDPVDDGQAVLSPGQGEVGQGDPLLQ